MCLEYYHLPDPQLTGRRSKKHGRYAPKGSAVSYIRDRVRQMENLLQETTIGSPGTTDIWQGIRALVQTGETSYPRITCN